MELSKGISTVKLFKLSNKKSEILLLLTISIILFFIPQLFWGSLYYVGGDDTRLYYIFPLEFFHYSFRLTPENVFYPKSYSAPFYFLIFLLKHAVPHVQFFLFGLNLALGFLFFYLFLGLWHKGNTTKDSFIKATSSLFYVLSTYLIDNAYESDLIATYLMSIMPIALYLFFKAVIEKKLQFLVLSVLIFSLFSSSLSTLPWVLAICITLLPVFISVFFEHRKVFFLYCLIFTLLFFFLNIYWIGYLIYPYFNPSDTPSMLEHFSSSDFKTGNEGAIRSMSGIFGPLNRVFNEIKANLAQNFSVLMWLKMSFLLIILSGGLFLKDISLQLRKYYLLSIACLIVAFYFFQPKIGRWGDDLFIFFNNNIPFFTMLRTMYAKFTFSMAFTYAFSFYFALVILSKKIKKQYIYLILVSFLFLIFQDSKDFLFKRFNESHFSYRISGTFNDDFNNLLSFTRKLDKSGKVMWIPLNFPNYIIVEDKYYPNHFYNGLSMLPIIGTMYDYTGYLSFSPIGDLSVVDHVFSLMGQKRYDEVGKLFQLFNIKYFIENKQAIPPEIETFLYSPRQGMLEVQNDEFKKGLFGRKLKDFGKRYSIYEINEKYKGSKIFISNDVTSYPPFIQNLKYQKLSSFEFDVEVPNLKGSTNLVLQEFYNKNWIVKIYNNDKTTSENYKYREGIPIYQNFASSWVINDKEIINTLGRDFYKENSDGSISLRLKLVHELIYFAPVFNKISLVSYLFVGIYILIQSFLFLSKSLKNKHVNFISK